MVQIDTIAIQIARVRIGFHFKYEISTTISSSVFMIMPPRQQADISQYTTPQNTKNAKILSYPMQMD
jgi:hypothetical protein